MKDLSIIVPTLGRKEQVEALLKSIYKYANGKEWSFEVIVVDQNFSQLLDDVCAKYSSFFSLKHFKVNFRGTSNIVLPNPKPVTLCC